MSFPYFGSRTSCSNHDSLVLKKRSLLDDGQIGGARQSNCNRSGLKTMQVGIVLLQLS